MPMTSKKAMTYEGDVPHYGLSRRQNAPMYQFTPAADFRLAVRCFPRQYTLPDLSDPADSRKLTASLGAAV
jgi:hypothetical protein